MKKIFTLALLAFTAMGSQAQDYNLFNAADCDAEGWLWLNTQEKIDKYVGLCNEDDYTVDPDGKIIQLAFANITPDYPETFADPDVYGVDTRGYTMLDDSVHSDECIKGAIVLAPASAQSSTNGGCLILNLPSCSTISLMLSSEASMLGRTLMLSPSNGIDSDNSTGENKWTGDTKSIYAKATLFSKLHGAGQWKWEGIETLNNGYNDGVTFQSNDPVYFALQNCHRFAIYVHAIRVTTPKQDKQESAAISEVKHFGKLSSAIYNLAGQRITTPARGLYIKGGKKYFKK